MEPIIVEPLGAGWAVRFGGSEPAIYRTGRDAEEAAKTVALRLAGAGEQVQILIKVRTGDVAARFVCLPPVLDSDRPIITGGLLPNSVAVAA